MKSRFLIVLLLLFLFIFLSSNSYAKSVNLIEAQKTWWTSVYPSLTITDLNNSIYLNKDSKNDNFNNLNTKNSKIKFKFKIIELFR